MRCLVGETIDLKYTISAEQARRDLAALEKATNEVGDKASKAATGWGRLSESMKGAQQRLGPTAAAISGISAALGENAGQAGKAVAAAGQMAAAFGSGGPAGVAIVAMTLIVNQLQKAWDDELKAQDAAIQKQYAAASAAAAGRKAVEKDIAALRKELAGPETGSQASARVQAEIDETKRQREQVINTRNALKIGTDGYDDAREQLEAERRILEATIRDLGVKQGLEFQAAAKRTAARSGGRSAAAADERDPSAPFLSGNAARRAQADRAAQAASDAADAALEADIDAGAARVQAARDLEDTRTLVAKIGAEERLAIEQEAAASTAEIATTTIGIVASASQQFISDIVSGQEHAAERFGLAIMQQAGQALVSFGTQAVGKGIMYAADPLTAALAPTNIATGIALIGSGVALGGIAAGASANISGGGSSSSPAAKERGTSSGRSGGGSSGSGSTNITIIYGGASGPTAEQGAAAVDKAIKRNGRRGR